MRSFKTTALAAALMVAPALASAQFSGAAIFGDSLSDAGQYGARFTTNPGLTAAEYVTQSFGFVLTPSFRGGLDFAQGGARVNAPSPLIPATAPNLSIAQQVTQLLSAGPLDPNALYQIQGGGNDLAVLGGQALAGAISLAQLQAGMQQAATDLVDADRAAAGGGRSLHRRLHAARCGTYARRRRDRASRELHGAQSISSTRRSPPASPSSAST